MKNDLKYSNIFNGIKPYIDRYLQSASSSRQSINRDTFIASTNATAIQGIPVATGVPNNNEYLKYNSGVLSYATVPTADLSNYVTDSELTTILNNYVTNTDLSDYITSSELTTALTGYALSSSLSNYLDKATYDTNNNGIVDVAASAVSVEWSGVQNTPSTLVYTNVAQTFTAAQTFAAATFGGVATFNNTIIKGTATNGVEIDASNYLYSRSNNSAIRQYFVDTAANESFYFHYQRSNKRLEVRDTNDYGMMFFHHLAASETYPIHIRRAVDVQQTMRISTIVSNSAGSALSPVYARDGSSTGIYFPSTTELAISVSNSQKMGITATAFNLRNAKDFNYQLNADAAIYKRVYVNASGSAATKRIGTLTAGSGNHSCSVHIRMYVGRFQNAGSSATIIANAYWSTTTTTHGAPKTNIQFEINNNSQVQLTDTTLNTYCGIEIVNVTASQKHIDLTFPSWTVLYCEIAYIITPLSVINAEPAVSDT